MCSSEAMCDTVTWANYTVSTCPKGMTHEKAGSLIFLSGGFHPMIPHPEVQSKQVTTIRLTVRPHNPLSGSYQQS